MVERAGVTGAGLATGGGDETGAEVVAGGLVEAEFRIAHAQLYAYC